MPDQSPTNDPMAAFGPNEWLVDELYQQYLQDKNSVDKAWWEFFEDYRPGEAAINGAAAPAQAAPAKAAAGQRHRRGRVRAGRVRAPPPPCRSRRAPPTSPTPPPTRPWPTSRRTRRLPSAGRPLPPRSPPRAAAQTRPEAKVEAPKAAEQPTPREPAGLKGTGPVSEAEVKAAARRLRPRRDQHGVLAAGADRDQRARRPGQAAHRQPRRHQQPPEALPRRQGLLHPPHRLRPGQGPGRHAGDEQRLHDRREGQAGARRARRTSTSAWPSTCAKPDGTRQLLVPSIKSAEAMDFAHFWTAYEDVVRKARDNKLTVEDFQGTTISLTNPGTIGTVHSVPAPDGRARARSSASARWSTPPSGRAPARRRSTATPSPRS